MPGPTPGVGDLAPTGVGPEVTPAVPQGPVAPAGPSPVDTAARTGLLADIQQDVTAEGPANAFDRLGGKQPTPAEPDTAVEPGEPADVRPEQTPPASVTSGENLQSLTSQEQNELKHLQGLAIKTAPEQARLDELSSRVNAAINTDAPKTTPLTTGGGPETTGPKSEPATELDSNDRPGGYYEAKELRELARAMASGASGRELAMHEQRIKVAILKDTLIRTGASKRTFEETEGRAPTGRVSRLLHRLTGRGERSEAASQADLDYAEAVNNDGRPVDARFAEAKKIRSEAGNELEQAKKAGNQEKIKEAQERYNMVNEYFLLVNDEHKKDLKKLILQLLLVLGFTATMEVNTQVKEGAQQTTQPQRR